MGLTPGEGAGGAGGGGGPAVAAGGGGAPRRGGGAGRLGAALGVLRAAGRNPALRPLLGAHVLFEIVEFTIWIALLVYAFRHGGATGSLVMSLVQLLPCALAAPALGAVADRGAPERLLAGSYAALAVTTGAVVAAIVAGAPAVVVFVLAPLTTLSLTASRPSLAAVLPAVVTTAEELTAASVMEGWAEGIGNVGGPALASVLVAVRGPALALEVSAGAMVLACVAALDGLRRAPLVGARRGGGARRVGAVPAPGAAAAAFDPAAPGAPSAVGSVGRDLAAVLASRATLVLLAVHGFYYLVVGAIDLLSVVLAAHALHLGVSATGYLVAAFGAGTVLGGAVSVTIVGRPRLAGVISAWMLVAAAALALLGAVPRTADAFLLLAGAGLGGSVFDVAGRTLLQRAAPSGSLAGAFSLLEGVMNATIALGALLARVAIGAAGTRGALLAVAAVALVVLAATWRPLRSIDAAAVVPQVEVRLLRSIPIFAALPAPALEGVARQLERVEVPSGSVVIREGERGDRWYAVAGGELAVTRRGEAVATLSRGDGFGEIALVRDVPRTATVTALDRCLLYALDEPAFRLVLTGHQPARDAAERLATQRLPGSG